MDSRGRKAAELKGNTCVNWEQLSVNQSQTHGSFKLEQAPSCWSSVQIRVKICFLRNLTTSPWQKGHFCSSLACEVFHVEYMLYIPASVTVRASSMHPASLNDNPGLDTRGNFQLSQNKHQKKYHNTDEAKETHGIKYNT